jgi:phospholipid/cholesterol/gamma-HCH transport system ATP-binding protein
LEQNEILKLDNIFLNSGLNESLNISFSLKRGENAVFFGPENSGVNIICPLAAGLIQGYSGDIFFDGKSIKSLDYIETHDFRTRLGYLQKDYGLISNMTVFENILLPLKYHSELSSAEIENIVNEQIMEMNLSHCKNLRPVKLTGSEKLKTAFLRSIMLDPDLILVEHSLEGQCIFNAQTFLKSLKKESATKAKSVIFVTYNPKLFIGIAERYIMLYNGRIVFEGSLEDFLLSDNQYLRQYFELADGPMKIE